MAGDDAAQGLRRKARRRGVIRQRARGLERGNILHYAEWVKSGECVAIALPVRDAHAAATIQIFCRVSGAAGAPWLTLLHGFPTSSWDFARVLPALEPQIRVLSFDFLGFGASDKPRRFAYSIHRQADLTEAVWRRFGVRRTWMVAHDYGVTVAQELLARQEEGAGATEIAGVAFLNGGLYADLHRPLRIQRLLRHPLAGPLVSALGNERMMCRNLSSVFSPEHQPSREDLAEHWSAIMQRGGHRLAHRLIHYMADRQRHHARWEQALENARMPLCFVWGMLDPVSGAHVAERIRARLPNAPLAELRDVGHYPQLEAPERVAKEILAMLR